MKQLIDDIKVKELQQVNMARKQQEKKMESLKEELEGRLLMIESLVRYSEELRSKGTAVDIARAASSIEVRASELMQFDVHSQFDAMYSPLEIMFSRGNTQVTDDLTFMFGNVQICTGRFRGLCPVCKQCFSYCRFHLFLYCLDAIVFHVINVFIINSCA